MPCARDLARHDVIVEYDAEASGSAWGRAVDTPFSPGYTVGTYGVGAEVIPLAACREIAWTSTHEPEPEYETVLIGCDPRGSLARAIRATSPRRRALGGCYLRVFDDTGREATALEVTIDIREVRPSRVGAGLVDIVSVGHGYGLPTRHERPVWDLWVRNPPGEVGTWEALDTEQRRAWLMFASHRRDTSGRLSERGVVPGGVLHLDGGRLADRAAFRCALGEALFGAGGCVTAYPNLHEVVDVPLRLIWHDAEFAREHWEPWDYAFLMDELAKSRITVEFR